MPVSKSLVPSIETRAKKPTSLLYNFRSKTMPNKPIKRQCSVCKNYVTRPLYHYQLTSKSINNLNSAESIARQFAFDLFANQHNSIDAYSVICLNCGFIFLDPRPTQDDLNEKYRRIAPYLETRYTKTLTLAERMRARDLRNYVSKSLKIDSETRVLDIGGANGRIMASLVDFGCNCYVVDMGVKDMIEGVVCLGSRVDDIPPSAKFELLISSHALEHLVNPLEELASIREHLADNGILYVEVPHGCYREVRRSRFIDLVGHVNYFSKASLTALLSLAGFEVSKVEIRVRRYSEFFTPCIVAIARPAKTPRSLTYHGWGYRNTLVEMHNPIHYYKHLLAAAFTYFQKIQK